MKILFTGASSFSGMWFIRELAAAGNEITAVFPRTKEEYEGLRNDRVQNVLQWSEPIFSAPFGSEAFIQAINGRSKWDLLCHHAADVYRYKSLDFDYSTALSNNTRNLKSVLEALTEKGCQKVLLTGSVFEQREGEGSDMLRAVSPYGLSKGLTSDVFLYYCQIMNLRLGKFVIPNPFGPYEEPRFTTFLAKTWLEGKTAEVTSPEYVRDNIPISLLAKAYSRFSEELPRKPGFQQLNPSCYVGSQGEFTALFSREMRRRLSLPCEYALHHQLEFPEPRIRVNCDPLDINQLGWDENKAWDELAEFYRERYGN